MLNQFRTAERPFGPIGVAGVYGVGPVAGGPGGRRKWAHRLPVAAP
jgi:hypothetical protein